MNILVTGAWKQAKDYVEKLEQMGNTVIFLQDENDRLPCCYDWVEGIIGNGIFVFHSIEKFVNLKYVQLTSAGMDRVPIEYVNSQGIKIYNARGVYSGPMAEYAVAGVLSLYKSQNFFREKQKQHIWEKKRDLKELAGQNICIVGCGSVGIECARRFAAFNCVVYGIDKKIRKHPVFNQIASIEDKDYIIAKSDVVVITLPLTEETYHFFNRKLFDIMKMGTVVVNIARGALIDTDALIDALKSKLGGAVLDVFEEEPLIDSPLWDMNNVIITPHNSFIGNGNDLRLNNLIMKNLEQYINENSCDFTKK